MAENLTTGSIQAPGFSGLNTQDSSVQLSSGFALEAFNAVIDKYGRIGARKGWTPVNNAVLGAGGAVRTVFEFVKADGNLTFAAANNKIYGNPFNATSFLEYPVGGTEFFQGTYTQTNSTITGSINSHTYSVGETIYFGPTSGTANQGMYVVQTVSGSTFTITATDSKTTSGSMNTINILTSYSITDDNWQVAQVSQSTGLAATPHMLWVQKDHKPLIFHRLGDTGHMHIDGYGFQRLGDIATLPAGYTVDSFKPSCALTAFGRVWVAGTDPSDTQTVYFSDLQNPTNWTTGTSGKLDISSVIPTGDPIVALAQHNNFLVIFCRRHIVVYANPTVPASITLQDTIKGVGCIARDSVKSVAGTDILFLSETGILSLQRTIQEKSLPFRDVSKNVRDELLANVNSEDLDNIKGVYYPTDAFYLLALPTTGFTYCFDTRGTLDNGAARTTVWKGINPTAFCVTENRQLYLGALGYIGDYREHADNGSSYRFSYYTNFFDFDSPTTGKILKKLGLVAIGGGSQDVAIKWGFDYTNNYQSQVVMLGGTAVYEYGTAEYGIAQYSNGIALDSLKLNGSGSGKVLQLGFESDINGSPLSIQKIDIGIKTGKSL